MYTNNRTQNTSFDIDAPEMYDHITVMLEKGPGDQSFGLAISGGREGASQRGGNTNIIVSDVIHGSPADTLVNIGDILVAINGTNVENVSHEFAVDLLRSMKKSVYLLLKRERPPSPFNLRKPSNISMTVPSYSDHKPQYSPNQSEDYNYPKQKAILQQNTPHTNCPTEDYEDLTTNIEKGKNGFGLYMGNLIYVKEKIKDTPAYNSEVQVGDIVISINDVPLDTCSSNDDVIALIKKSGKNLKLGIIRPNVSWLPSPMAQVMPTPYKKPADREAPLRRPRSSSFRLVNEKPLEQEDARHSNRPQRAPTSHREIKDELDQVFQNKSRNIQKEPPQRHRSSSFTQPPKFNRFDMTSQQSEEILERPASKRGRSDSKMSDQYESDQIVPVINEVHRKNLNLPRSPSTKNELLLTRAVKMPPFDDHMGIQLLGGNKSGIFVSAVMPESPADYAGLKTGDQIITVNDIDFRHLTREEAVIVLLSLKNCPVTINCVNRLATFEKIKFQAGDEFYIRANFDYLKPENPRELVLNRGQLLLVRDSMYGGTVGSWSATKVSVKDEPGESGVIPNKARAEQLAMKSRLEEKRKKDVKRRLKIRRNPELNTRSEYQSQDRLDTMSFNDQMLHIPAYEMVTKKPADFKRPIIIIGVASDIFRQNILQQHSDEFEYPCPRSSRNYGKGQKTEKGPSLKLFDIKQVINKNKHPILDISPEGVEMLHHVNLSPIIILVKMVDKKLSREFRSAAVRMVYGGNKDPIDKKEARNINRYGLRFQRRYPMYLTAVLEVYEQSVDRIFSEIIDIIRLGQKDQIFVSDQTVDQTIIDAIGLQEPRYSADTTDNSESGTEDEYSLAPTDDSRVFKENRFESTEETSVSKNNYQKQIPKYNGNGRVIDIQYEGRRGDESDGYESDNQQRSRTSQSSYTSSLNPPSQSSNQTTERKTMELTLNAVLRVPLNSQGGLSEAPATKVSVYVPPNAFGNDVKAQELFMKIFLPKESSSKVENDVPFIVCGPQGLKFKRPVEIRMPHDENTNENIESRLRISPEFSASPATWSQFTLDREGANGKSFNLSDNMIALLVDRF